jgi:hypothetical protein
MAKDKMISKVSNNIIDEMGTLINDNLVNGIQTK